jgi:hypothetical protein
VVAAMFNCWARLSARSPAVFAAKTGLAANNETMQTRTNTDFIKTPKVLFVDFGISTSTPGFRLSNFFQLISNPAGKCELIYDYAATLSLFQILPYFFTGIMRQTGLLPRFSFDRSQFRLFFRKELPKFT